jgi:hypothetical protein
MSNQHTSHSHHPVHAVEIASHPLALSLGGYCQIAGLAGVHGALGLSERLKTLGASISTRFDKVTDENIKHFHQQPSGD